MCFQISFELQFGKHITNGKLLRVEYEIKLINIVKNNPPHPLKQKLWLNYPDIFTMVSEQ